MVKQNKIITFFSFFKYLLIISPLRLTGIVLLTAIEGFVPVYLIVIMKDIIDLVATTNFHNQILYNLILLWIFLMIIQYTISILLRYLMDVYIVKVSRITSTEIMNKGNSLLGIKNFENKEFQEIFHYIKNSDHRIENFINNFRYLFKNIVQFISVLIIFISLSYWIPFAVFLTVIPGIFLSLKKSKMMASQEDKIYKLERKANYYRDILISPKSFKEVKIFSFDQMFRDKYNEFYNKMTSQHKSMHKKAALLDSIGVIPRILGAAGIMLYLTMQFKKGYISIGSIALFLGSIFQLSTALAEIIQFWAYFDYTLMFYKKLQHFQSFSETLTLCDDQKIDDISEVEFRNVCFSYDGKINVLNNVSFKISRNCTTAIVGENGAGKTTIIKLILRLYDPTEGDIFINGINLKNIDPDHYRKLISGIFQDFQKYNLSFKENVTGMSQRPLNELNKNIDLDLKFIEKLQDHEETFLGLDFGGKELSGGQWQKVAILRSLAKQSKMLLVDEPTSSIDPLQEVQIYNSLLCNNCPIKLLVTHRLGSIKLVSKILVLKNSKLIEQGTHDQLINKNGYYAELYKTQADLYIKS